MEIKIWSCLRRRYTKREMSKGKKNCSKSKEKENKMEMFMEGLLETCENKEVI